MFSGKKTLLLIHVLAWLAFVFLPIVFLFNRHEWQRIESPVSFFTGLALSNILLIAAFYVNYFILVPRFYFTKKFLVYISIIVGIGLIFLFILRLNPYFDLNHHLRPPQFTPDLNHNPEMRPPPPPPQGFVFINALKFVFVSLVSLGLRITQQLKEVEQQNVEANLQFLKAQINPHFLFNTLNSIYSLAVKKSDLAPEAITKLSSIMRYVTTGTNHQEVALQQEIEYLQNYVDLQKLRLTNNVQVDFTVKGSALNKRIAPLLFIPFIENCFKYGVSTEKNSTISILLEINGPDIRFITTNTIVRVAEVNESSGTGLKNVKQRLELLYPQHQLWLTEYQQNYIAELKLTLPA